MLGIAIFFESKDFVVTDCYYAAECFPGNEDMVGHALLVLLSAIASIV